MKRRPHWEVINDAGPIAKKIRWYADRVIFSGHDSGPLARMATLRTFMLEEVKNPGISPVEAAKKVSQQKWRMLGEWIPHDEIPRSQDWLDTSVWAVYAMFAKGGERIYKIARHFGEQLAKTNLDISGQYLPSTGEFVCIEFPEQVKFRDERSGDYFHCAYVAVENWGEEKCEDFLGNKVLKSIDLLLPCFDESGKYKGADNTMIINLLETDQTLSDSIERARTRSTHPITCVEVISFIIKCLVYINSGDPDLREYRPPRPPQTQNPKKIRRWERENEDRAKVRMTLVGYEWQKDRQFKSGEVSVRGHFRWQPYGPEKSRVKLIWIDEHKREYGTKPEEEK